MTERRCQNCHRLYAKRLGPCPECGTPPYGWNKALHTAQVNNALHRQVADAKRSG